MRRRLRARFSSALIANQKGSASATGGSSTPGALAVLGMVFPFLNYRRKT